ncbi:MAG: IS5 family transposase [Myxococcota bacterium]
MENQAHRRHDISDRAWDLLKDHLPGRGGSWGGRAKNNRLFLNAVFWIFRTGSPWRDLPSDYGDWKNTHRRFCRWRDTGMWESLLEKLIDDPDFEWLMIGPSYVKAHFHEAGAIGGNQDMNRTKGGFNSKIHLAVDAHGMPVRALITKGSSADYIQAPLLIGGFVVEHLLAGRAYDTDAIVDQAKQKQMQVVIPPKRNRAHQRQYDKHLHKLRHLVKNAFLQLKQWRGIATRYAKNTASFLAAIQIRGLALWLKIS